MNKMIENEMNSMDHRVRRRLCDDCVCLSLVPP